MSGRSTERRPMTQDEEARYHMQRNPDHEVIVGEDDQWHCLTCEDEEDDLG